MNIRCWRWSFSMENGKKSKILRMKYPLNIFLHNIASWHRQISTHKVAKIQLKGTKIYYTIFFGDYKVLKMKFSTENGRKSNFLRMKHPLNIFLQTIASWYRQISTHKVAKMQLLGAKIHYAKFLANIRCWKWTFSTENGRKSNIPQM